MSTQAPLTLTNTHTRRIVIGGCKGQRPIILGGSDDKNVVGAKSQTCKLEGPRAERFRSGAMGDLAKKLGLSIG